MKTGRLTFAIVATLVLGSFIPLMAHCGGCAAAKPKAAAKSECVYELRTYTTNEGKLPNLHARFRDHTIKIFKKHGMESVAYWVPTDEAKSKNTLIYILRHKSLEAAKASWKAFGSDPAWRKVAKESQVDGKFLAKRPDRVYLKATSYFPKPAVCKATKDSVCQLRIYTIKDDMCKKLDERFAKGTIKLFAKHGIESLGYFHPADEKDKDKVLYYVIRFKNQEATKTAWKAFVSDPAWAEFRKPYGRPVSKCEAVFMKAADYSPALEAAK